MSDVTRRSVAKGAAQSVPAIAVASASPAMAVSYTPVDCTKVPALSDIGTKWADMASGTQSSYDKIAGHSDLGMRTMFSLNLGMQQFTAPADYVTGYQLTFGNAVGIVTASGVQTSGSITNAPVEYTQVIGAGLAMNLSVQSGVPYKLLAKKAYNYPVGFSVLFCVTWLAGFSATSAGAQVGNCCYYLNYDTPATVDSNSNYPDNAYVAKSGDSYSVALTQKYGSHVS